MTLHRVGPDAQAPIDSIRAGSDGGYRFRYRATGSDRAIYFVTATYDGITYFTPALTLTVVRGAGGVITVFDTASRGLPLTVRGRHLVVSATDTATRARTVIEVFELSNDSVRTLVGADSGTPTWTTVIPDAARDVHMEQGDIPADATSTEPGRLRVYAPFAPGIKQFSFSYRLPETAFPLTVPVERATGELEVLVEDPAAEVRGVELTESSPMSFEGRPFRRFVAERAPAGGSIRFDIPRSPARASRFNVLTIVGAVGVVMLITLAAVTMRRGGARAPDPPRADAAERMAREIADLDISFERQEAADDAVRSEYHSARAALKARLTAALARRDGDA